MERAGTPNSYPAKHRLTASAVKTSIPHTPSIYWVCKRAAKNIRLHMQKTFSRRRLPIALSTPPAHAAIHLLRHPPSGVMTVLAPEG